MRILAFSDWRVQSVESIFQFVEKIEPVDLILYAGDDIGRFEEEGINYFSELSNYTKKGKVLAVIGNDDLHLQKKVLEAKGVHDLYNRSYCFNNFIFIGLEASTSGPALFRHTEEDFEKHLNRQLKNVKGKRIIILPHIPPFGILDRGIRFAEIDKFTNHIGSKALTDFIENHHVDLVICGHCHSQGGMMDKKESTTIVNVSSHDTHGSKGNFAIIELTEEGNVNVNWYDTSELLESSSLMLIYGIGPVRSEKFRKAGIKEIVQLANYENLPQLVSLLGFSENSLQLLQFKAKSILNNRP
jgi:Icc-related predicted phosphoesterase